MNDEKLMARYSNTADPLAFTKLHDRYAERVKRWVRAYVRSHEVADAAQETWTRLHQYAHRYDESKPFAPWLSSIAISAAMRLAKRRPNTTSLANVADPADKVEIRDRADLDLFFALCGLQPEHHRVVTAIYYRGRSLRDVAAETGLSLAVVRRIKRESLACIRKNLKKL